MKEFIVNEYITLKLEDGKTNIYVDGKLFRQCTFLLIDIPIEDISTFDDIESIDEVAERSSHNLGQRGEQQEIKIPPETEFWGHCSNLQVWAENNYNTQILHRNIAFPLLKELTRAGDPLAKKVFKEEIAKRLNSGHKTVILYLLKEGYVQYLTQEEKELIFYKNSKKIKELVDTILEKRKKLKSDDKYILRALIGYKDMSLVELLKDRIMELLSSTDINQLKKRDFFDYLEILFRKGISFDRSYFFYENNKIVKNIIDKSLEVEKTALEFGFLLLSMLVRYGDSSVENVLKEAVIKWLFSGKSRIIKLLISHFIHRPLGYKNFEYNNYYLKQQKRLFSIKELVALYEDNRCPDQLFNYLDEYLKDFNKIYSSTKERIISKKEISNELFIPTQLKLHDSDFFLLLFNKNKKHGQVIINATIIPIYKNDVKKITINNSESSCEPIIKNIEKLRMKLSFQYECVKNVTTERDLIKNVYELYFFDSDILSNEEIIAIFTSIADDIKIEIKYLNDVK